MGEVGKSSWGVAQVTQLGCSLVNLVNAGSPAQLTQLTQVLRVYPFTLNVCTAANVWATQVLNTLVHGTKQDSTNVCTNGTNVCTTANVRRCASHRHGEPDGRHRDF